ncbi:uncharacterized protein LOC143044221 isoform X1 [Mytilus galloprovincialis]|uniref:uncharacterized protein LOC143044221 isoform X1 n=1 Tax=Mytilus galloprovincialis TaxID=29158 RepID=UPI003F7C4727
MIGATHSQMYNRIKEMLQNGKYEEKIAPVDIWDFGGQDVYYVTHQLFICYRGTFILVFDGSKQMNDRLDVKSYLPGVSEYPTTSVYLLHWVNSILTYCKNTKDGYPKILFVATHKDLLHKRTEDIYTCRHGQVLKDADLQKRPTNKQLAQLSRRLSKDSCKELAIHLKVSEDTIQSIWDDIQTPCGRLQIYVAMEMESQ